MDIDYIFPQYFIYILHILEIPTVYKGMVDDDHLVKQTQMYQKQAFSYINILCSLVLANPSTNIFHSWQRKLLIFFAIIRLLNVLTMREHTSFVIFTKRPSYPIDSKFLIL